MNLAPDKLSTDNPSVAHLGKGAVFRYRAAMPRPDDTPPDTPLQRAIFAVEVVLIAVLTIIALASPIVTWLRS